MPYVRHQELGKHILVHLHAPTWALVDVILLAPCSRASRRAAAVPKPIVLQPALLLLLLHHRCC
eukprot:COSAG06_NODE_2293_length_7144_cov_5.694677_4_plen_64_part_00